MYQCEHHNRCIRYADAYKEELRKLHILQVAQLGSEIAIQAVIALARDYM